MYKKSSNRAFGIFFFYFFRLRSLANYKKNINPNIYLIIISIIFLLLGILNSKFLTPLNKIWIKLGEVLGRIIAPIILSIIYFLILTPISLILRILGKDLLNLKYLNNKSSYWLERKKKLAIWISNFNVRIFKRKKKVLLDTNIYYFYTFRFFNRIVPGHCCCSFNLYDFLK